MSLYEACRSIGLHCYFRSIIQVDKTEYDNDPRMKLLAGKRFEYCYRDGQVEDCELEEVLGNM